MPELNAILDAQRSKEYRSNKFVAALQGVNLDDHISDKQDKFDEIQRRVQAKLTGKSESELEMQEFGLDVETEE